MYGSPLCGVPVLVPSGCTPARSVHASDQFCHLEHSTFATGLAPEQLHSGPVYNTLCYVHTPATLYSHFIWRDDLLYILCLFKLPYWFILRCMFSELYCMPPETTTLWFIIYPINGYVNKDSLWISNMRIDRK